MLCLGRHTSCLHKVRRIIIYRLNCLSNKSTNQMPQSLRFIARRSNTTQHNLNKNTNQMYFVLKSLKFYLHYSALHVLDTIVSIIRGFSAAHAVSGPVWCLVLCVLQSCFVVTAVFSCVSSSYNTAGLEDTTNEAPHGTRDCMCSGKAPDDGQNGVRNM